MSATVKYRVFERDDDNTLMEFVSTTGYSSLEGRFDSVQEAADAVLAHAQHPTYCIIVAVVAP